MARVWIKICGVTSVEDAVLAADLGVDAIGVNLIPSSPRYVEPAVAREITRAIAGRACPVGVVANFSRDRLSRVREAAGIEWLQLHGDETPDALQALLPCAYKALCIASTADVERATAFGGDRVLVDAKVDGQLGGTGRTFDWSLVRDLSGRRPLVLAGGLHPANVANAIESVRPWGVDVASGVERDGDRRRKDAGRLRAFVAAVRASA
jgi:phosphoribosylanthranilate isomerase